MTHIRLYYLLMAAASTFGLAKSAIYAFLLGPEEFGAFNLVAILATYAFFALSAGLLEGVSLHLPRIYGEGQDALAHQLIRTAFVHLLGCGIIGVGFIALLLPSFSNLRLFGLAMLTATSMSLISLLLSDSRSRGDIVGFGGYSLIRVLMTFILGVVGAWTGGMVGAVLGEVAGQVMLVVWVFHRIVRRENGKRKTIPSTRLWEIRREGCAILLHQLFLVIQQSLDRLLVLLALGTGALGQYSFAAILVTAAALVHATLYQQVGPEALRNYGAGIPLAESLRQTRVIAFKAVVLAALLGLIALFASHALLNSLLQAYRPAVEILPWLIAAAVFQIAQLFDWIVAGVGRATTLAQTSAGVTIVQAIAGLAGIWYSMPLWYFAFLTMGCRLATMSIGYYIAEKFVAQVSTPGLMQSAMSLSDKPDFSL